jgi:hypothetical protein
MTSKEYFITKLTFRDDQRLIKDVLAYEFDGNTLSGAEVRQRSWMVNKTEAGSQISIMTPDKMGKWIRRTPFSYVNGYYNWEFKLPENSERRKTFVSYYHRDDQGYRETFENLFGDLIVSKSLDDGDIDSDNSDEYCKKLIQNGYLDDTTVLVVLIGPNTKCRKHVDWEISGALDYRVGDCYAGLLGLFLPSHPNYGSDKYTPGMIPERLHKNAESGYAILQDWTDDRVKLQEYIEAVFAKRNESDKIQNKSIPQMTKNLCE